MKRLTIYTNIPTPYQQDFFNELSHHYKLKIIYYSKIEKDRYWKLNNDNIPYETVFLKSSVLAKILQYFYKDFHFSWSIILVALKDNPDYVIMGGNYLAPNTIIASVIYKFRQKSIGLWAERLHPQSNLIIKFIKNFTLLIYKYTINFILGVGQTSLDCYNNKGFHKPNINLPYSINEQRFVIDLKNQNIIESLIHKYDLKNSIVVLTSGSLIHRKGIDIAINIINETNIENIKLIILGDGPLKKEFINLNNNNIILLGFQQQNVIPYYFALSNYFLFTTRYDGWGLVINEAISAGLPVITSDSAGASELIINNENGYVFSLDNYGNACNYLRKLINDNDLTNKIREDNKKLAIKINSKSMSYRLKYFLDNIN